MRTARRDRAERQPLVPPPKSKCSSTRLRMLWWAACLVVLAAAERVTFKALVDRMGPYRYVGAQAVLVCYLCVSAAVALRKLAAGDITPEMHAFPKGKLALMSFLDYLQLVVMIVSAANVAPTLTALLLQLSVPLTMVLACCFGRTRRYSLKHVIGGALLTAAVALCLYRPINGIVASNGGTTDGKQVQTQQSGSDFQSEGTAVSTAAEAASAMGWSTIAYTLACVPAAASGIYKEHALAAYGMPMDPDYLALWVGAIQLALALLTAPLAYKLQDLLGPAATAAVKAAVATTGAGAGMDGGGDTNGRGPAAGGAMRDSLRQGWQCWLFMRGPEGNADDEARCSGVLGLVIGHVAAAVLMMACVTRLLIAAAALADEAEGPPPAAAAAHSAGGGGGSRRGSGGGGGGSGAAVARPVYRSIAAGLLAAFAALATYAGFQGSPWVEDSVNPWTGVALLLALAGLEVYHLEPEPDAELLTTYHSPTRHDDADSLNL